MMTDGKLILEETSVNIAFKAVQTIRGRDAQGEIGAHGKEKEWGSEDADP